MSAHVLLGHFPISLILVGAVADLAGFVLASAPLRRFGGWLLILGGVGALAAFMTGSGASRELLARAAGDPVLFERIEAHSMLASLGAWLLAGAAVLRFTWRDRMEGAESIATLVAALLSAVLVLVVGFSGMAVRHG